MDRAYMWKKQAAAVFFPQRKCPVCGGFSRQGACADCLRDLAALRPCPVCATFIAPTESEFYRCRGCREEEPHFEHRLGVHVSAQGSLAGDGKAAVASP